MNISTNGDFYGQEIHIMSTRYTLLVNFPHISLLRKLLRQFLEKLHFLQKYFQELGQFFSEQAHFWPSEKKCPSPQNFFLEMQFFLKMERFFQNNDIFFKLTKIGPKIM